MPHAVRSPRARREKCRARTPADRWARASYFELLRCGGHREDERQATKSRATCPIPGWRTYKLAGRNGVSEPMVPSVIYMTRSEEHTSELQSHSDLVCRLLLEKKEKQNTQTSHK